MAKSFNTKGLAQLDAAVKAVNRTTQTKTKVKSAIGITFDSDLSDVQKLKAQFPDALERAHRKTLIFVAEELEIALGLAMEANVWGWKYGDGDIVDTGELRDSIAVSVVGDNIKVTYGAEYAAIVYYGGYIHPYGNPNVQIYMPGRPWINNVLNGGGPVDQFDIVGTYNKKFTDFMKAELKAIGAL